MSAEQQLTASSPSSSSPSSSSSTSSSQLSHDRSVYIVLKSVQTRSAYAFHCGDGAHIAGVYGSAQAANAAAAKLFLDLHSSHEEVSCNLNLDLLQIVAEGDHEGDVVVSVERQTVEEGEAEFSVEKLRKEVRRRRRRAWEQAKLEEELDGGYDSYGKPLLPQDPQSVRERRKALQRAKRKRAALE